MENLFLDFLRSPTPENYSRALAAVVASPDYDPYSNDLNDIQGYYDRGQYEEAREAIRASMPNLLLSPRLHMLAAMVAEKRGDREGFELERAIYRRCLEGILATGDGSPDGPYRVSRTSDEYDVLFFLDREFTRQRLVHQGKRSFDVMSCADGSELWFDITPVFGTLESRMGGPGQGG